MSKLQLTFACGLYDRMQALYTGEVQAEGIDLNYLAIDNPREIFDRMGGGLEFDACEMSSSETISRLSAGNTPLVALPVFASRVFRHGHIAINKKKIKTPKDLEGKRIGVPLYTQTAAIFIRGLLQHEYGVDLSKVQWVQGALNTAGSHGSPSAPPLLKRVEIEQNHSGKSLSDLLAEGALDAITGADMPKSYHTHPEVVGRLFPNYREVEKEYYRRTKIFPIMHLIAIKRELYEKHPFVATSLYNAFETSKNKALEKMRFLGALRYMMPWLQDDVAEIDDVFGGDPWPYGIEPNRPTLQALVNYLAEQSLIKAPIPLEDIFVPVHGHGAH